MKHVPIAVGFLYLLLHSSLGYAQYETSCPLGRKNDPLNMTFQGNHVTQTFCDIDFGHVELVKPSMLESFDLGNLVITRFPAGSCQVLNIYYDAEACQRSFDVHCIHDGKVVDWSFFFDRRIGEDLVEGRASVTFGNVASIATCNRSYDVTADYYFSPKDPPK